MTYSYMVVERIPDDLKEGIVYHNVEFELAAMLCACGCGHRVDLLVPDSHQISSASGLATIRPSVAVCDAPCKSHFFITGGRVEWLQAFTKAQAVNLMRRQIARHASQDLKPRSWIARLWAAFVRAVGRVKELLRL